MNAIPIRLVRNEAGARAAAAVHADAHIGAAMDALSDAIGVNVDGTFKLDTAALSGLVDAVAELVRIGLVDSSGRLVEADAIRDRLATCHGGPDARLASLQAIRRRPAMRPGKAPAHGISL